MTDRQRRMDIEGLRGAAILCVVLFHAGVTSLAGGFVGVDVFFVLSGYFITALLVRELAETGTVDLPRFYAGRMLRLLPLMLVVLLATMAAVMLLYAPIDRPDIVSSARFVALAAGNLQLAQTKVDYFRSGVDPLLHTWSLGVEVQFYLLWPLVILAIARLARRKRRDADVTVGTLLAGLAFAGVLSLAASLYLTSTAQPWAFFNLPARIWEFALGGILSLCLLRGPLITARTGSLLQLAGLTALGWAVMSYDGSIPYPGVAAILPALAAVALILGGAAAPDSAVGSGLSFPPLRWLGRVSYAWYLWHWPLIGLAAVLSPTIGVGGKLVSAGIALVLAAITHRSIELALRTRFASASTRSVIGGLAIACGAVFLIAHASLRVAARQVDTPQQRAYLAARTDRFANECWATTVDAPVGPCEFGDAHSDTAIVLFGDSHAQHWLAGLDAAGKAHGWKIVAMVKGGCPVADVASMATGRRKRYYAECVRYRDASMNRMVSMRPSAVILSSWDHYLETSGAPSPWHVSADDWQRGLAKTYARFTAAGITTIAMRDVPNTPFDVPACLSRRAAGMMFAGECTFDAKSGVMPAATRAQDRAMRGLPVRLIDMNDHVCSTTRCGVLRDGLVVYGDDNHLTSTYSRALGGVLGDRVSAALR